MFENDQNREKEGDLDVESDEDQGEQVIADVELDPGRADGHFAGFIRRTGAFAGASGADQEGEDIIEEDKPDTHHKEHKHVRVIVKQRHEKKDSKRLSAQYIEKDFSSQLGY